MKHLYESIFDDDILDQDYSEESFKQIIKNWIDERFHIFGKFEILYENNVFIVNAGEVFKKKSLTSLTNGMFEWGEIDKDFDCSECPKLTSLKGGPKIVRGDFNCSECPRLTSLEGAPEIAGIYFIADQCNFETLKGISQTSKKYILNDNKKLKSLKYLPKNILGLNISNCPLIKNFKDGPDHMMTLVCDYCTNLEFDGLKSVTEYIQAYNSIFDDMDYHEINELRLKLNCSKIYTTSVVFK